MVYWVHRFLKGPFNLDFAATTFDNLFAYVEAETNPIRIQVLVVWYFREFFE
jgi:hypothetical protein